MKGKIIAAAITGAIAVVAVALVFRYAPPVRNFANGVTPAKK